MAPAARVRDLTKRRGARDVLAGVAFDIEAGQFALFEGSNGAGKSTLVKCLAGISRPSRGMIEIAGRDPREPSAREALAYLGDTPGLYGELTVEENAGFRIGLRGERLRGELARFGVGAVAGTRVRALSRGERQRAALAIAFASGASVLLFDEPASGLDDAGVASLVEAIAEAKRRGAAVIATAPRATALVADRKLVLANGRLAEESP